MKPSVLICFLIVFLALLINGCDVANNPDNKVPPPVDSKNSTWMYTSDAGESWFVYKLYYCDKLFGVSSFNQDQYSSVIAVGDSGMVIVSLDGGGTWKADTIGIMKLNLNALAWTGESNTGVAVGNQGTILWTNVEGQSWSYMTTPTSSDLFTVAFDSVSGVGFAAGSNETLLISYDRGLSWSIKTSVFTSSVVYKKIAFANTGIAAVVGYNDLTSDPVMIRTSDGGQTWSGVSLPGINSTRLYGISFLDSLRGVAVGSSGVIIKTTNGGLTWTSKSSGVSENLFSVSFSRAVCLVTGDKIILRSVDFGETWSSNIIGNANGSLYSIFKIDSRNYFVAGD